MSTYTGKQLEITVTPRPAGFQEREVQVSAWETQRELVRTFGGIAVHTDPNCQALRLEYPDTQQGRAQMATLMTTVTIQSVRDFNPVISDTEALEFALAGMHSTKLGFEAAKLSTPRWLLNKIKEAERVLAQRQHDEKAAALARLTAQAEALKSREEKLDAVLHEIAQLKAELGEAA